MARQKKFATCYCSNVSKPTKLERSFGIGNEYSTFADKCECKVNGKRMTKHGRDDYVVEVIKSKRKGYEWS
jgi:hypothetical protein